ncbi:class I SAM-dependent methyltransferase [Streptomyces yerevanensis]|uniref:class I SAM-dependent methyltransferase n=1 Tax=Streptomyces yerevanensis TaxID=66378 RepID=UPI00068ED2DF|nr:class I SAM-dependent methyltransferase [Streptomyces yerevanensis]
MRYLMEDPREARRLSEKVTPDRWVGDWIDEHLKPGMDVLDAGCGPGTIARTVADRGMGITVTGADIGSHRVAEARRNLGDKGTAVEADVRHLPFPDDSFDFSYCRLMLQFVPDLAAAIHELARVTRPGGKIVLYELDGQLNWNHPIDDRLQTLLSKVLAGTGEQGFDWQVGRKLYTAAVRCGLRDIDVAVEPYHLIAGAIDPRQRSQWQLKFDIAKPTATAALGSSEAAEEFFALFMEHLDRPDTLTYSVAFAVTASVPAGEAS